MRGKIAYIVADLEGSTGAWTKAHTLLATPEWQEARVELTRDLNAAAGARKMNAWGFPRKGRIIRFHAEEFLEMYENLLKIAYFPRLAYTLRHLAIPLTRVGWRIQSLKHL